MKRVAFLSVVIIGLACAPGAFAQAAKPAAPAAAPSADVVKARMAVPVKGTAYIEVISEQAKRDGKDILQKMKVKNVSAAPIAGLQIYQYWYSKAGEQVTGDTARVRAPIAPGEVVDIELRSPMKGEVLNNRVTFQHANGKVDAKGVKKFTDDKAKK